MKIVEQAHRYYLKNKSKIDKYNKEYLKGYKENEKRKQIRKIKKATSYKYPISNQKCEFCDNKATERHHNTLPYETDKFSYICKKCHREKNKETKIKKIEKPKHII